MKVCCFTTRTPSKRTWPPISDRCPARNVRSRQDNVLWWVVPNGSTYYKRTMEDLFLFFVNVFLETEFWPILNRPRWTRFSSSRFSLSGFWYLCLDLKNGLWYRIGPFFVDCVNDSGSSDRLFFSDTLQLGNESFCRLGSFEVGTRKPKFV